MQPAREQFVSPAEFRQQYLEMARPGYFPQLVRHTSSPYRWPACTEWGESLRGLRADKALQSALVDVEISRQGRGYGDGVATPDDPSWMKVAMPFHTFQDAFIDGKIPWESNKAPVVGYVAQQNLFETSNELVRQCPPLPHATAGPRSKREQWRRNVWIGGQGSFTPIHRDPYENLFAQVVGSKRFHLFPPSMAPYLHLFSSSTTQPNTSSIPTEECLLSGSEQGAQYPGLQEALSHPDTRHVVVEAGDVLYIPQSWFHCVQSTSISASVNAWFR